MDNLVLIAIVVIVHWREIKQIEDEGANFLTAAAANERNGLLSDQLETVNNVEV